MTNKKDPKDTEYSHPYDEPPPPTDDDYYIPESAWNQLGTNDPALPKKENPPAPGKTAPVNKDDKRTKKDLASHNPEYVLKKIFHFDSFRPYQQNICESVIQGNNVLLVMPTGSGKSLCYQLPGIVRGGTTLVVSPLIALMEDQTAHLKELGLAAERIHSGRTRLQSRVVSRDYLDGNLDFLFIAPERLAVPGFSEMLAKRKPVLIAIDEAHCISQWGHDFRPDYRLLGERLPIFRSAPVIAMTATATPRVQQDIIKQLRIDGADMRIHGFRRTNIAIELVEILPSNRTQKVIEIIKNKESRPAIIYAPTRKKTEELAEELEDLISVAPYHAGLPAAVRDKVQTSFLSGELDAIVATIAFGMGIDKPDIRTVIHTALPGSLEGYYQEIGRAGRDGKPSRAILLQSYGDRRLHLFFHEKSYPHENALRRIYNRLTNEKIPSEKIRNELKMEEEEFETALEKLWIHGGALVSPDEKAQKGHNNWHLPYKNQSNHRLAQIDEIAHFASSFSCRMLYLVEHFGDREDDGRECGVCDFCAPENSTLVFARKPNRQEEHILRDVISMLKSVDSLSTGMLYSDSCPGSTFPRADFENLLKSLVKSGLIMVSEHSFEKEERIIHYKRAGLTEKGRSIGLNDIMSLEIISLSESLKQRDRRQTPKNQTSKLKTVGQSISGSSENPRLYETIREWRLRMAKKRGVPAFRIFTNQVLDNLARDLPTTNDELLMVHGVGPYFVQRYGREIIRMVEEYQQSIK